MSSSIGVPGSEAVLGAANIIIGNANFTLLPNQYSNYFLNITSSVSLTAQRNIIAPNNQGQTFVVKNTTSGGFAIQIIGSSGTGVSITNGQTITVLFDGINYIITSASGGGSPTGPAGGDLSGTYPNPTVQDISFQIANANVSSSAAIAGSKVDPTFGQQAIETDLTVKATDYTYWPRKEPIDDDTLLYWTLDEATSPFSNTGAGAGQDLYQVLPNPSASVPGVFLNQAAQNVSANSLTVSFATPINPPTQSVSISLWIYPNVSSAGAIISKKYDVSTSTHTAPFDAIAILSAVPDGISPRITIAGTNQDFSYLGLITGSWNHIGITWDGITLLTYLNGAQIGSEFIGTGGPVDIDYGTSGNWFIGAWDPNTDPSIDAIIDDIRIEGVVRSLDYFKAIYNAFANPDLATALHPGKIQLAGDLGGDATAPIIEKIGGVKIDTTNILDTYVLTYVAGDGKIELQPSSGSGAGPAGGDLSGTYPNPTVAQIQTIPVLAGTPTDGQVLTYIADNGDLEYRTPAGAPVGTAGGDLSGTYPNPTVAKIQNFAIATTPPNDGYLLAYNTSGGHWEPRSITTVNSGAGLTTAGGDLSGTYPNPTVAKIQNVNIDTTAPTNGQSLVYNSGTTKWSPFSVTATGAAGGDLTGTYPNPTVINLSGIGSTSNDTGTSFNTISFNSLHTAIIYAGPTYQFNFTSNQNGANSWSTQLTFTLGVSGGNVAKFIISATVTNSDGDIWAGELKFIGSTGTGGTIVSSDAATVINKYAISNGGPGLSDFDMRAVVSGGSILFETFGPAAGGNQNVNYIITEQKITHV